MMKPDDHKPPMCRHGQHPDDSVEEMLAEAKRARQERLDRVHEAEQREATQRDKLDVSARRLFVLLPIFIILIIANLVLAKSGPGGFSEKDQITAARLQIYMAVTAIEAYQDTAGCPPASLRQIDAEFPGIRYELVGSSYKVSARVGSQNIMYMRGEELAPFAKVEDELVLEVSP